MLACIFVSSTTFAVEGKMSATIQDRQNNIIKGMEFTDELKDIRKKNRLPVLMVATDKGDAKEVIRLIERGENVDQTDDFGATALMMASYKGYTSIMQILINHGASVNKVSIIGTSPLFHATEMNQVEAMKLLIKHGAEVNDISSGATPLIAASGLNYTAAVKILLKNGAKVDLERDLLKTRVAKFVKKETYKPKFPNLCTL